MILDGSWAPRLSLYPFFPPTKHLFVKGRHFVDFVVEHPGREGGV